MSQNTQRLHDLALSTNGLVDPGGPMGRHRVWQAVRYQPDRSDGTTGCGPGAYQPGRNLRQAAMTNPRLLRYYSQELQHLRREFRESFLVGRIEQISCQF